MTGGPTTTQTDGEGDGVFERKQSIVQSFALDGDQHVDESIWAEDGSLLSHTRTTTNDDGLIVTVSADRDGDGIADFVTTSITTLEANGDIVVAQETRDASDTLRSGTVTTTSDKGRVVVTDEDMNGDGIVDRTVSQVIADDGTATLSVTEFDTTGGVQSAETVTTTDNGLSTIVHSDRNGDGVFELSVTSDTVFNIDGSVTEITSQRGADGTIHSQRTVTTSDDGLSRTWSEDLDFDGLADFSGNETTTYQADGVEIQTSNRFLADGSLIEARTVTISADKNTIVETVDLDGNGYSDFTQTRERASDGSRIERSEYQSTGGVTVAVRETTVSRSFGSTSELQTHISHVVDGSGLDETWVLDFDGAGGPDRTVEINREASGASIKSNTSFSADNQITEMRQTDVSAYGRTTTEHRDFDGDQQFDQRSITHVDADRQVTVSFADLDATGQDEAIAVSQTSANGLIHRYSIDHDADGVADIIRTSTTSFAADGAEQTAFVETIGGRAGYQSTLVVSGDGLTQSETFDYDGDGSADGMRSSIRQIQDDGSIIEIIETVLDDGTAYACEKIETSADGRTVTQIYDFDGNGIADKISVRVVNADRSVTQTERSFNEAGVQTSRFVTETSADGFTVVENRNGSLLTTHHSELEDGSYSWEISGRTGGLGDRSWGYRTIDDLGITEWTLGCQCRECNIRSLGRRCTGARSGGGHIDL